jgi:3-oxo-5-alpha-steroid 4-dehydrogenase 3 / polyprenol reductase
VKAVPVKEAPEKGVSRKEAPENETPQKEAPEKAASQKTASQNEIDNKTPKKADGNPISSLLDYLATFTVPHSYFTHFYVLAVLGTLFWGVQLAVHGNIYRLLRDLPVPAWAEGTRRTPGGQSIHQVVLAWTCFLLHTGRRLLECLYIQKQGKSRMWITHYLLGMVFYAATAVSIWIEGTGTSCFPPSCVYA